MIKSLLTIFIFISSWTVAQENKNDWKTLKSADFSIEYPSDWELNESRQMGTSFFLFSPLESEQDNFKENINLIVQDLSGYDLDLAEYSEISENEIKRLITKAIIIQSEPIKMENQTFHQMIYSGTQGTLNLKYYQRYYIKSNKAYVLTFTCEENKFDVFKKVGETILNSFQFKQ